MNCCNEYGHCTGGHNCPARATTLVDASRKALAVLSLTGADPALQNELVGAMAEPDRRVAELTAQLEAVRGVWQKDIARIAELAGQRDELLNVLTTIKANAGTPERVYELARTALTKHQPTAAPAANTP